MEDLAYREAEILEKDSVSGRMRRIHSVASAREQWSLLADLCHE